MEVVTGKFINCVSCFLNKYFLFDIRINNNEFFEKKIRYKRYKDISEKFNSSKWTVSKISYIHPIQDDIFQIKKFDFYDCDIDQEWLQKDYYPYLTCIEFEEVIRDPDKYGEYFFNYIYESGNVYIRTNDDSLSNLSLPKQFNINIQDDDIVNVHITANENISKIAIIFNPKTIIYDHKQIPDSVYYNKKSFHILEKSYKYNMFANMNRADVILTDDNKKAFYNQKYYLSLNIINDLDSMYQEVVDQCNFNPHFCSNLLSYRYEELLPKRSEIHDNVFELINVKFSDYHYPISIYKNDYTFLYQDSVKSTLSKHPGEFILHRIRKRNGAEPNLLVGGSIANLLPLSFLTSVTIDQITKKADDYIISFNKPFELVKGSYRENKLLYVENFDEEIRRVSLYDIMKPTHKFGHKNINWYDTEIELNAKFVERLTSSLEIYGAWLDNKDYQNEVKQRLINLIKDQDPRIDQLKRLCSDKEWSMTSLGEHIIKIFKDIGRVLDDPGIICSSRIKIPKVSINSFDIDQITTMEDSDPLPVYSDSEEGSITAPACNKSDYAANTQFHRFKNLINNIHNTYNSENKKYFDPMIQYASTHMGKFINSSSLKEFAKDMEINFNMEGDNTIMINREIIIRVMSNMIFEIEDIKFHGGATIVFWADGTKTVVSPQEDEKKYDVEKAIAMAYLKKILSYNKKAKDRSVDNLLSKWTEVYESQKDEIKKQIKRTKERKKKQAEKQKQLLLEEQQNQNK